MATLKDKHKIFWMVKGYITDDDMAEQCYNGYVKRLWYNEEAYRYAEGFEEAYEKKFKKNEKNTLHCTRSMI